MRKSGNRKNPKLMEHQLKILAGIISKADGEEGVLSILNTILTQSEKAAISQRVSILKKLNDGFKYHEIQGMYGVSPSTITKALDLYLKHGGDNSNFNQSVAKYKEPKLIYKSDSEGSSKERSWVEAKMPGAIRLDKI